MRRMMQVLGGAALLLSAVATGPTLAAGTPPGASAAYTSPTTLAAMAGSRAGGTEGNASSLSASTHSTRQTGKSMDGDSTQSTAANSYSGATGSISGTANSAIGTTAAR